MGKISFYMSLLLLYLFHILTNILVFHIENINDYGNCFLIENIILLTFFGFLIYKTNPFNKNK